MNFAEKWIYALKIKSWPKLFVPFLLGQSFGVFESNRFHFPTFGLGFLFTLSLVSFIVLLNDYADIQVDTIKRKLFPNGCSPKTIPDNILPKNAVLIVGIIFGFFTLIFGITLEIFLEKPFIIYVTILCILVFVMYSLPPIQLNYRGGGEFLEMMGVGAVLPLFHYYLHKGFLPNLEFLSIVSVFSILSLTSAMASGLSDEESDRQGGKITFVTHFGNRLVRKGIFFFLSVAFLFLILFFCLFSESFPLLVSLSVILFYLYQLKFVLKYSNHATTNQFQFQGIYKDHLHKLIWGSILIISIWKMTDLVFIKIR